MKDALDSIVGIILQGCPFLVMTKNDGEQKTEISLAQRVLLILVAFVVAGAASGLTVYVTMNRDMTIFNERQQGVLKWNAEQDSRISRLEAEMRERTDDRYRGSEARRDREALERQISDVRDRVVILEAAIAYRDKRGIQGP